jgi:8-amino-7-oxononanoate synthase
VFYRRLETLKEHGLFRGIRDRLSAQGPRITIGSRELINFSSNDYLGLSNHPHIIDSVKRTLDIHGYGSAASRLLSGGTRVFRDLEEKMAIFKDTEAALIFNSGYSANTGSIPALAGDDTTIYSDELNHASIIDGCRLSRSKVYIYRHKDTAHLRELLRQTGAGRKLVVTDTVFSMSGEIAPVPDICSLCEEFSAILYLDDAHGTGVLGNGKGTLSHFGTPPDPSIIQMGTFSKAFGSLGGFVAGSGDIIEWIVNTARSFMFSTALPSCVIAASLAALELIGHSDELLKKLWINRDRVADGLKNLGVDCAGSETPIIPIHTGDLANTLRIAEYLYDKNIYAPAIRPPTVKEPLLRLTVTAAHTEEDIELLLDAMKRA